MQTKYDAQTFETGRRLQSDAFDDRLALRAKALIRTSRSFGSTMP